jgi:hypothetical protein
LPDFHQRLESRAEGRPFAEAARTTKIETCGKLARIGLPKADCADVKTSVVQQPF